MELPRTPAEIEGLEIASRGNYLEYLAGVTRRIPEMEGLIPEAAERLKNGLVDSLVELELAEPYDTSNDQADGQPSMERLTLEDCVQRIKHGQLETIGKAADLLARELPDEQPDTYGSAKYIVGLLVGRRGELSLKDLEDPFQRHVFGTVMHDEWVARTVTSGGQIDTELNKPFDDLSFEQQEKIIEKIRLGIRLFFRQYEPDSSQPASEV